MYESLENFGHFDPLTEKQLHRFNIVKNMLDYRSAMRTLASVFSSRYLCTMLPDLVYDVEIDINLYLDSVVFEIGYTMDHDGNIQYMDIELHLDDLISEDWKQKVLDAFHVKALDYDYHFDKAAKREAELQARIKENEFKKYLKLKEKFES